MIEHAAARLADRQEVDELAVCPAREPIRHERRALRRLLRHRREPLEQAGSSRARIAPLTASTRASRPDSTNSAGPGTDSASATAVFTALSMNASDATRSCGVAGCASRSTGSLPSFQPATVVAPPRNSSAFDTVPAR